VSKKRLRGNWGELPEDDPIFSGTPLALSSCCLPGRRYSKVSFSTWPSCLSRES
jgi:hypothetical protein